MQIYPIPVRPYSSSELAALYGISCKILKRWLDPYAKELGPKVGRYFNGLQVKIIFDRLGAPGKEA